MADEPLYYYDYLQLDKLLGAQELESARRGHPAHDEHLFIVVHQAYELWFKQILWELDAVLGVMGSPPVPEKAMGQVVHRLRRITEIQRLLISQLEVLETMTALDFLDFRDDLIPASGFQSAQFRLVENRLGLIPRHRLKIKGAAYTDVLSDADTELVRSTEDEPSLLDLVNAWLERTPFLSLGKFDFWRAYRAAIDEVLAEDRRVIEDHPNLDAEERATQLQRYEAALETYGTLFDRERWEALRTAGQRRLSHQAVLAALLINLYRDEPIFQLPFRLLTALVDIDEGFTSWRHRHAIMVHRMIGGRIGTGGTSGHEYLEAAARKHRVFKDLFDLPTFFIARSKLPELPPEVREQMDYRYSAT